MEFQRINTTNLLFSYNQKLNAENPCLKGARVNNNMGYRDSHFHHDQLADNTE